MRFAAAVSGNPIHEEHDEVPRGLIWSMAGSDHSRPLKTKEAIMTEKIIIYGKAG